MSEIVAKKEDQLSLVFHKSSEFKLNVSQVEEALSKLGFLRLDIVEDKLEFLKFWNYLTSKQKNEELI